MNVVDLKLALLREAPWNPNVMDSTMRRYLQESITRYGLLGNLVVRPLTKDAYEVLSGNQRLRLLQEMGYSTVPCVIVDLNDAQSRLLSQAMNRIQGTDDFGLRAELVREILKAIPESEVLSVLPDSSDSLKALVSLGQENIASYLQHWQQAQEARLTHLQFQLLPSQLGVVEEALARLIPEAKESDSHSPNMRGTALYLLCRRVLEMEEESP